MFLPNAPHQTMRNDSPNQKVHMLPEIALPTFQQLQNATHQYHNVESIILLLL
jgi:hypothetical protein